MFNNTSIDSLICLINRSIPHISIYFDASFIHPLKLSKQGINEKYCLIFILVLISLLYMFTISDVYRRF